jgi:micrococcal nuclease
MANIQVVKTMFTFGMPALLLATPAVAKAPLPPEQSCLVVGVSDGDTITARCGVFGSYKQLKVRLSEIDAPEKAQPFGQRSKEALSDVCFNAQATLKPVSLDRYGRTVARVVCRGKDVNLEQVRTGMAWSYTKYLTDQSIFDAELQARKDRTGLWHDPRPVPPWEWRAAKRTAQHQPP